MLKALGILSLGKETQALSRIDLLASFFLNYLKTETNNDIQPLTVICCILIEYLDDESCSYVIEKFKEFHDIYKLETKL